MEGTSSGKRTRKSGDGGSSKKSKMVVGGGGGAKGGGGRRKKEKIEIIPTQTKMQIRRQKQKILAQKKKEKKEARQKGKEEREALGDAAPPKKVPQTIESLRLPDDNIITGEFKEMIDIMSDEFSPFFAEEYVPKIAITSSQNPNLKTRLFMKELARIFPNSEVFLRRNATVKKMVEQSIEKGYSDIIVINEHQKEPSSLLLSHLPTGPTFFFRLSSVQLTKQIKRDWREITSHLPECVVSNFTTRIGVMVGRLFCSLFNQHPNFKGRRVVTFHNQRDYIFFRHHLYEFKKNGEKAALRELGPRFTLKLKSIQKGTFDSKTGEYEWIVTDKRHKLEFSRRKFYL